MPGIVVFRRRWSVGSDDLVVPGLFLFLVHLVWMIVLGLLLGLIHFDLQEHCTRLLFYFIIIYMVLIGVNMVNELGICIVALRGSILDTAPRSSMRYFLYTRFGLLFLETGLLVAGCVWLVYYYPGCPIDKAKQTVLGLIVCNWCIIVSIVVTVWCTYDAAGRSWVKMKKYQRSMKESESKFQYKRSGSTRNWRQRKVLRAYQDSWHQRCRFLFCCMRPSDRNRNSFADIARLLSDFFRDLDVVPSDVVAGLVLLRKFQKIERKAIVEQRKNDTYEFLSGVAITPRTQFLSLQPGSSSQGTQGQDLELFQTVIHFAHFAVRAYGWPIYVMTQDMGLCQICTGLRCCCLPCGRPHQGRPDPEIVEDNCCKCNFAALEKLREQGDIEIIYATYHVDVGETPFFVALDYDRQNIVISIRGTLSMKDILTDLNAEGECLPVDPVQEDWLGHKGMVQAAQYILDKLKSEGLIERALHHAPEKGTMSFQLVCVGHSLGAGTACILGILLRQEYPDLLCYCYSPPGGLLSLPAVEYTKSFTISVVMGKDVVPRIGLHQMEALRADLINAIKRSVDPKWKTIACSVLCCGCTHNPTSAVELSTGDATVTEYMKAKDKARCFKVHPQDSSIALTSHQPLYPPGKIIHVVRHHPTKGEQALSSKEPVYQALWAQNADFDEVLISPVMIQDHMPDKVLDALNKVITTPGPRKPQRSSTTMDITEKETQRLTQLLPTELLNEPKMVSAPVVFNPLPGLQTKVVLETSFTSLQSPSAPASNASSSANGFHSTQYPSLLGRHNFGHGPKPSKTMSLDLPSSNPGKIDLIHDDWFGLAPLASPESLSELSSISSRASFLGMGLGLTPTTIGGIPRVGSFELKTPKVMRRTPKINNNLSTCADDIQSVRYYEKLSQISKTLTGVSSGLSDVSSELSGVFLGYPQTTTGLSEVLNQPDNSGKNSRDCLDGYGSSTHITNSSSNLSYESASSHLGYPQEDLSNGVGPCLIATSSDDFQSVEDILDSVMQSAGCADFFNSKTTFLETHFDEAFESQFQGTSPSRNSELSTPVTSVSSGTVMSSTPLAPLVSLTPTSLTSPMTPTPTNDPDIITNFAIDLNLDSEHRSQASYEVATTVSNPNSKANSIDSGSMCRTPSDHTKNVTFNPQVINIEELRAPQQSPKRRKWNFMSAARKRDPQASPQARSDFQPKTILSSKQRRNSFNTSDEFFARSEALPLLSNLGAGSERTSPNFVRRKKYVYPAGVSYIGKGSESSV